MLYQSRSWSNCETQYGDQTISIWCQWGKICGRQKETLHYMSADLFMLSLQFRGSARWKLRFVKSAKQPQPEHKARLLRVECHLAWHSQKSRSLKGRLRETTFAHPSWVVCCKPHQVMPRTWRGVSCMAHGFSCIGRPTLNNKQVTTSSLYLSQEVDSSTSACAACSLLMTEASCLVNTDEWQIICVQWWALLHPYIVFAAL
jgi:hypothetical protein